MVKSDITRQRFDRLVALKVFDKTKQGYRWLCECDCGNTTVARVADLRNGHTKSCGCYSKDALYDYLNEVTLSIGDKFGKLEVVKHVGYTDKGEKLWECSCKCGGSATVSTSNLKSGNTVSCGCWHKEVLKSLLFKHGELNPMYNPVLTPEERENGRNCPEEVAWVKNVYRRDKYTCQCCGSKSTRVNAHHIYNYATYRHLRWILRNGITLCERCHTEFHKIYGKQDNTWAQLSEFFNNKGKVLRIPIYRQSIKIA